MGQHVFFAHTDPSHPGKRHGEDGAEWQLLEDHLIGTAELARQFAATFGAGDWGYIAGLWHDLGKGTLPWQAFLRRANGIVDEFAAFYEGHPTHAAVGAQRLHKYSREAGKLLAYCVAGHHGGLPNWDGDANSGLKLRLEESYSEVKTVMAEPEFPANFQLVIESERLGFQLQFFVRMLFSCLVDADYLDTEKSMNKEKSGWRPNYPLLTNLHECFWSCFNKLREKADPATAVNRQREIVLRDCLAAAELSPGLFSLTVPTGGGKTLASLAFALEHAKLHNRARERFRRIIYVIPFTSIIEQNAKVFREMLGDEVVLEHHSNFIPDETDWKTRLATENWDAPVVVTTNVQFFDSFFANKTSKCRKLHNVAGSIVIFDEVQAIPVEKLKPCLEVIRELSANYGVTSVLCTATQPAIEFSEQFESGLKNVDEIIQDVPTLFDALIRTEEVFIGELNEEAIASRLEELDQVLCIVNTRQHALDVFDALPSSDSSIHLSALMYPVHRTRKLDEVRRRLVNGLPCRVVSTQLIEAGVDIDFPCVFRAVSGIDSIAQAAGRCNRNGSSDTPQKVFVFEFPEDSACSFFRQAAQSAKKLFEQFAGKLTSPECVRNYFIDFFWKNEQRMDSDGIVEQCFLAQSGNIQFKDIAEFRMIKSATIPIVVALEKPAEKLARSLERASHKGGTLRQLQQYTVQIYSHQFDEIKEWLESPIPGIWVLYSKELYSKQTGLKCKPPQGQAFFG